MHHQRVWKLLRCPTSHRPAGPSHQPPRGTRNPARAPAAKQCVTLYEDVSTCERLFLLTLRSCRLSHHMLTRSHRSIEHLLACSPLHQTIYSGLPELLCSSAEILRRQSCTRFTIERQNTRQMSVSATMHLRCQELFEARLHNITSGSLGWGSLGLVMGYP